MTSTQGGRLTAAEHLERAEVATVQAEEQEEHGDRSRTLAALAVAHATAGILRLVLAGGDLS